MGFPEVLRETRTKMRMSQRELGEELGCSQILICCFEKGKRNPSFTMVKKIVEVAKKYHVKVRLRDLFDEMR